MRKKKKYRVSENGCYLIFDSEDFPGIICCDAPEIERFGCEMVRLQVEHDESVSVCSICPHEEECIECVEDQRKDLEPGFSQPTFGEIMVLNEEQDSENFEF